MTRHPAALLIGKRLRSRSGPPAAWSDSDTPTPCNSTGVAVAIHGRVGVIVLNRPHAANALTPETVQEMVSILESWSQDPDVDLVLLTGAGDKDLCVGLDPASLQQTAREPRVDAMLADIKSISLAIADYPKPFVAIMSGDVLGDGIGICAYGSHRVVTDSTRVGVTDIGSHFVPRIGSSYLLSRSPGGLGRHLALTGTLVGPGEAIEAGLADCYVPWEVLPVMIEELISTGDVSTISRHARQPPTSLPSDRQVIDRSYAGGTVEEILATLEAEEAPIAIEAAKRIRRNSPIALQLALEFLRNARDRDLAEVLDLEYLASRYFHGRGQRGTT